ncbi:MAG: hypothetical protein ABI208_06630, partial [Ginsengibacter sp.]
LCGLMILIIFSGIPYMVFLPAMITFLLAGFVSSSRLIVSDHTPFEIYVGLILGILSQLIAFVIIG